MALIDEFADLFAQVTPADTADSADGRIRTGVDPVADACGFCGQADGIRNHPQPSANAQTSTSTGDPQNPQVPQAPFADLGRRRLVKLAAHHAHPLSDLLDWYADDLVEMGKLPEPTVRRIVDDYIRNAYAYRWLICRRPQEHTGEAR